MNAAGSFDDPLINSENTMKKKVLNRILALLLTLLLTGGILSGCRTPGEADNTAPTEETGPIETEAQTPEKTTFGLSYISEYGFNPYSCTCVTNRPVISLVYESLFVVNEEFQPEPVLCKTFGVSEDGLSYLFCLHEDACFADSTPVTAYDVVASLRAASNSAYYGDRFRFVRDFSAYNDTTVRIDLYTPYENLPLLLDVAITKNRTADDKIPIGSGPFCFDPSMQSLRRNHRWWQGEYEVIADNTVLLQAATAPIQVRDNFEFGDTKLVLADPNSAASVGYRCDYELWNCNTTVMQYLGFNTYGGVFANSDLRMAITYLIDRETICAKLYNGFAVPASLPCSPFCGLYDKELAGRYAYAPDEFLRRMENVPISTTVHLLVWSADYYRVALANSLVDALAPYGLNVKVDAVDFDSYKSRLKSGNFDMFIGEVRLSNDFDLYPFFDENGALNFGALTDADAIRLSKQTLANSGNAYDLYEHIMERGLICPILFKSYAVMATRGTIPSLQPAVDNVFHLPGGRTLADASVTFNEAAGIQPEPETEPASESEPDAG